MHTPIPVIVDGQAGIFAHSKARVATLNAKAKERLCLMDARIRALMAEPEEGAATAEYAVVLVAATGFAAVLVAILTYARGRPPPNSRSYCPALSPSPG